MSKSKTNKSHKVRVTNFKNAHKSKKMNEQNLPKNPIANQFPIWSAQENIEMNGLEFEAIYNFLNLFRQAVMAGESILQKNIQTGKIKWKFEDAEGKELPKDVVEAYQKEIASFFQAQQSAQKAKPVDTNSPITADEQKDLPKIDSLVDQNGNTLK